MKNCLKLILTSIFIITTFSIGLAGGWPQPKGNGFFKLDFTAIHARKLYGADGSIFNLNGAGTQLGYYNTSFYGEYGITNRLTVVSYVPFFVRNKVNEGIGAITGEILQPGLSNNSIGDIDLGLRYGLFSKGGVSIAALLFLGLPTGDATNENLLFTGDGEFNQLLRLEAGVGAAKWYATGYVGFNNRTNNFSDEFRYEIEFGHKFLNNQLIAGVKLAGIKSFNNGDPTNGGNGLFANNVEFLSPQAFLAYEFKNNFGVSAQIAGVLNGQNVLAAPSVSFGVYRKLN